MIAMSESKLLMSTSIAAPGEEDEGGKEDQNVTDNGNSDANDNRNNINPRITSEDLRRKQWKERFHRRILLVGQGIVYVICAFYSMGRSGSGVFVDSVCSAQWYLRLAISIVL
jgi:hypothetical protein